MNMREQLIELLNIHAPSGKEKPVRDYLEPLLDDLLDTVTIDGYGNLLGKMVVGTGNGATIMFSAHMDTVKGVREDKIILDKSGIITAQLPDGRQGVLGADDRAGIAIILTVLKNIPESFNGVIKVAFSVEEEIGCIGAEKIDKHFYDDVDLAIIVDRRGNRDIVVGCNLAFCSNEVGSFMESVADMADMPDWKCVEGGVSDAMTFSSRGINSINLSAGYQNEHTSREFVSFYNMKDTVKLIIQTLAVINTFYHFFGDVPLTNQWLKQRVNNEILWEEVNDEMGDIYAYTIDDDIVIQQGDNEIIMSEEAFEELAKKIFKSLDKRVVL